MDGSPPSNFTRELGVGSTSASRQCRDESFLFFFTFRCLACLSVGKSQKPSNYRLML